MMDWFHFLGIILSLASCYNYEEEENVALGKLATQSSTSSGGVPERGIDGDRRSGWQAGSCTHTAGQAGPWWRVDLYNVHNISSVAVTNRWDCCWERINGAEIRIGNSEENDGNSNPFENPQDDRSPGTGLVTTDLDEDLKQLMQESRCVKISSIPKGTTITYQCHGMLGRYVNIFINQASSVLTVCEVEVYARVVHEDACKRPLRMMDSWRNIAFSSTNFDSFPHCDSNWAGRWTRFPGIAGDIIPESCVASCCSGSLHNAYLGFTHPKLGEGVKKGIVHLRTPDNCSTSTVDGILALACPGGYYIYRLPLLPCPATFAVRHHVCASDSCGPNALCTTGGGCECAPGYRMPEQGLPETWSFCYDINECEDVPNVCGPNANCTNTNGSHTCTCHEGYRATIAVHSFSNPCEDVDECLQPPCGPNTICYNTPGSYYCTCLDGFISSSGLTWEPGVTVCISAQAFLASLDPPEGMTREMLFLNEINLDLENNPDLVLSEKTVTSVLAATMAVTANIEEKDGEADTANMVLSVSEGLVSTMVDPKSQENNTSSQKTVKTSSMEINLVSLKGNVTEMPPLLAKGNMMSINLASVAEKNNGFASAAVMSVGGVERFMSSNFFQSENATEMYSDVITATLPKTKHKELSEPVNFTMYHKKKYQAGLVTCVYWKEMGNETHWSVEGCTATFSNETHTVCSCTHLSTFAILLQRAGQEEEEDPLLEIVNLVCMSVGLSFLALAVLTFLLCTWNPKVNNTARLHLSICLFLGHLLFLVGVSRTENAVACAVIAGLLHFLFLAGFVWMLLETLQLFLLVRSLTKVQVIQKEGLKALYLLLIGYGIPMVIVGVSAAVFSDGYGSKDACWIKKVKHFEWSFIGPVAAILALNLVSFCVILWKLQPTLANMKSDVSQSRDTRLIIFKIVAQFFVLGCAWILGFYQSSVLLKYLFIIINSQQGTFIFIVHCLLNKEVREEYKRWFSCLFRKKEPSANRGSANSISTVQQ